MRLTMARPVTSAASWRSFPAITQGNRTGGFVEMLRWALVDHEAQDF